MENIYSSGFMNSTTVSRLRCLNREAQTIYVGNSKSVTGVLLNIGTQFHIRLELTLPLSFLF